MEKNKYPNMNLAPFLAILMVILCTANLSAAVEVLQESSTSTQVVNPESLRVMINPTVFKWYKLRYEAEVLVSAIYPNDGSISVPESLIVWIDVETPGASFWVKNSDQNKFKEQLGYLVVHKDQVQAKGEVHWPLGGEVKLKANVGNISTTVQTYVVIPWLLLIVCCIGGAIGGWLRRCLDPNSVVELPFRLLPEKWSRKFETFREIGISIVAGFLLYLFNAVSPVYPDFRTPFGTEWLVLAPHLCNSIIGCTSSFYAIPAFIASNLLFRRRLSDCGMTVNSDITIILEICSCCLFKFKRFCIR